MKKEINKIDPHQWVNVHADYLYAYTFMRIGDEELSKDLVQETFLAALEKVDTFEGRSSERTWLTAILKYKIIDVYRKKSSGLIDTDVKIGMGENGDFFEDGNGHWTIQHTPGNLGNNGHDHVINKELNLVLMKCIQKLPALWRSVFTMKHIDDEATDIICAELKLTPGNFWIIIHRTKLNLRACLQKNGI
jgi:RNA polymerase sigma-70 factor (TIGR02943 family)